jgi:hypothetical protein
LSLGQEINESEIEEVSGDFTYSMKRMMRIT